MKKLLVGTLLASLALTGCQSKPVSRNICAQLPDGEWWSDKNFTQQQKTEFCVTTWAYRLAPSSDNAETVVKAVAYACRSMIAVNGHEKTKSNPSQEMSDLQLIEDMNRKEFYDYALYRVVQARAGKCPVPVSPLAES